MDEHVIGTYVRAEPRFVQGQGAELVDEHGDSYLDLLGGIAVNALGHGHPGLSAALHDQLDRVVHVSNLFRHELTETVATQIAHATGLHSVFFTNSGTESVEAALKVARKHHHEAGGRHGIVALHSGFHGRTMGALSVTSHEPYRAPFAPLVPGVSFVTPGDTEALTRAFEAGPPPAAMIVEPIQGEGGIVELPHAFLQQVRALCDETGTVLIHDEVQCGTGRTGTFLAGDHAGIKPDVVTLAKPLGAGLPMGAIVVREELARTLVPGDHGSTFAGGALACRAAHVLLTELENGLLETVRARGEQLRHGLLQLQQHHAIVTEVRGRGLMLGIRLERNAPTLQRALFERRVITNCTAGDVVRFLPPYVISAAQIEQALDVIAGCLADL